MGKKLFVVLCVSPDASYMSQRMSQNPYFMLFPTVEISTTYSFSIRVVSHPRSDLIVNI